MKLASVALFVGILIGLDHMGWLRQCPGESQIAERTLRVEYAQGGKANLVSFKTRNICVPSNEAPPFYRYVVEGLGVVDERTMQLLVRGIRFFADQEDYSEELLSLARKMAARN